VPVIPGALSAEAFAPMRSLWRAVAREAADWSGTVIADMGRLQPGHTALPIVQAADAVVLLARPTVDGLYHLRDRVTELAYLLGDPARPDTRVMVGILVAPKQERNALAQVRMMLEAIGSPVQAAAVSEDSRTVQALLSARLDRRADKMPLLTSAADLAEALFAAFPRLSGPRQAAEAGPGNVASGAAVPPAGAGP
jgi:hypothetical protein